MVAYKITKDRVIGIASSASASAGMIYYPDLVRVSVYCLCRSIERDELVRTMVGGLGESSMGGLREKDSARAMGRPYIGEFGGERGCSLFRSDSIHDCMMVAVYRVVITRGKKEPHTHARPTYLANFV
jgi:hypothetical protein